MPKLKDNISFAEYLEQSSAEIRQTGYDPEWWYRPHDEERRNEVDCLIIEGKAKDKRLYFAFSRAKATRPFEDLIHAKMHTATLGKMVSGNIVGKSFASMTKVIKLFPLPESPPWDTSIPEDPVVTFKAPAPVLEVQTMLPVLPPPARPTSAIPKVHHPEVTPIQWWTNADLLVSTEHSSLIPIVVMVKQTDKDGIVRSAYLSRKTDVEYFAEFANSASAMEWAGLKENLFTDIFVSGLPIMPKVKCHEGVAENLYTTLVALGADRHSKAVAVRHSYAAAAERLAKEIVEGTAPEMSPWKYWSDAAPGTIEVKTDAMSHIKQYSESKVPRPLRWKHMDIEMSHIKAVQAANDNKDHALLIQALNNFATWLRQPLDAGECLK